MQRKLILEKTAWQQCSGVQFEKKHSGCNAAKANRRRNSAATMQRSPIREETTRLQCSGGKSEKKQLDNNAAETNWSGGSAAALLLGLIR
jgi:hypothetical protein